MISCGAPALLRAVSMQVTISAMGICLGGRTKLRPLARTKCSSKLPKRLVLQRKSLAGDFRKRTLTVLYSYTDETNTDCSYEK